MRLAITVTALALRATPAGAAMDKADCKVLSGKAANVAKTVDNLRAGIADLVLSELVGEATAGVSVAAGKADVARDAMVPTMAVYVATVRKLVEQLDACAR